MARINLLPWREELRRKRQREFLFSVMMVTVLGVVLVFLVGLVFGQRINHQEDRNQAIQREISQLQIRINRIDQLDQTWARLLSRKAVIENLQSSRSLTVEMLDHMAKTIPVGVTLNSVRQQGMNVRLSGFSQSNARVSAYMQSLERNELFQKPDLGVVKTSNRPQSRSEPFEFNIGVVLKSTHQKEDVGAAEDYISSRRCLSGFDLWVFDMTGVAPA